MNMKSMASSRKGSGLCTTIHSKEEYIFMPLSVELIGLKIEEILKFFFDIKAMYSRVGRRSRLAPLDSPLEVMPSPPRVVSRISFKEDTFNIDLAEFFVSRL